MANVTGNLEDLQTHLVHLSIGEKQATAAYVAVLDGLNILATKDAPKCVGHATRTAFALASLRFGTLEFIVADTERFSAEIFKGWQDPVRTLKEVFDPTLDMSTAKQPTVYNTSIQVVGLVAWSQLTREQIPRK